MEMLVEVISREAVKPSSPTPHHLKTFNLCLLDQMTPAYYTPMMFFYPVHKPRGLSLTVECISSTLKKSLSEALARFYPLAGRLDRNNLHIDCNDAGILYVEAQVRGSLSEFLKKPEIGLLDEFLPLRGLSTTPEEESVLLGIQVNVFSCRG
ncbi:salutaridinol 7-O-acetyltransferase [Eucalyptus grandis]|uniref:salutaridinol 7-O-acetyltransferase n=1 Tax=Eucalyptus grandis TaxID=71139 RepID=UPI00192E79AA|nr:salutaridinol 7-O-acetyltransferase [Eucalyptus grandis]